MRVSGATGDGVKRLLYRLAEIALGRDDADPAAGEDGAWTP